LRASIRAALSSVAFEGSDRALGRDLEAAREVQVLLEAAGERRRALHVDRDGDLLRARALQLDNRLRVRAERGREESGGKNDLFHVRLCNPH